MKSADAVPDVTMVLLLGANCMIALTDSALLRWSDVHGNDTVPLSPAWKAWLDGESPPGQTDQTGPLDFALAPTLVYQSTTWDPSSMHCRNAVAFPQYDWLWEEQVRTACACTVHAHVCAARGMPAGMIAGSVVGAAF